MIVRSKIDRSQVGFAVLAGVQLMLIMSITMLSIALPAIQNQLGLSAEQTALVNCSYGLSFSGLLLLGGRLADHFSRRTTLVAALLVFLLGAVGAAGAPNAALLVGARFVQGAGAAMAAPAAMALIGGVFLDGPRRTRALALWGTLSSVGAVAGTLFGGFISAVASWRWMFGAVGVATALAVILTVRLLPTGPAPVAHHLDILGAALITAGLSAISYGLLASLDYPWSAPQVVISLGAGVAFITGYALGGRDLVPGWFWASTERVLALVVIFVTAAAIATTFFLLSLYFQQVLRYSAAAASLAFVPMGVTLFGMGLVVGRLIDRFGARAVCMLGLACVATGLFLLSFATATHDVGAVRCGLLILPIGVCLSFAAATVTAVRHVPDDQAGVAGGVLNAAMETGPTVGVAALVSIAGAHASRLAASQSPEQAASAGYSWAFLVGGAATVLLAAVVASTLTSRGTG
jgi:MFS family permease